MNKFLLIITIFCLGYVFNDLTKSYDLPNLASKAHAEVAGMSYYDLKSDRDFKRAVQYVIDEYYVEDIVDDCTVDGGYISGDSIYGLTISC